MSEKRGALTVEDLHIYFTPMASDLSRDEIRERLRLVNPELTKEAYEIAKARPLLEVGSSHGWIPRRR
jgi:hypothetical protein